MRDGIDVEEYYDLSLLTELSLSSSGDRVAFVASESDPDADESRGALYVAPTDGTRDPHRLTRASGASAPTWGPEGESLSFLAARTDDLDRSAGRGRSGSGNGDDEESGDGEENGDGDEPRLQVWTFDLALGGDARQETDFDRGVREFDVSPDGERLVVSARDPTREEEEYLDRREEDGPIEVTRLQHKRDGAGWLDDVTTYLFVGPRDGSADEAEFDRLDDAYGAGSGEPLAGLQPAWGPTDRIAFCRCEAETPDDSGAYDVLTVDPDGGDLRVVTDGSLRCGVPAWSPDGARVAFTGGNYENWYEPTEVFVARDEAGADYESLSAPLDRTVPFGAGDPAWLDDERVVTPIADEAWTRLAVLPLSGEPRRAYDRQGRSRTIEAFDLQGETVALGLSRADDTPNAFALDAAELREGEAGGPLRRLSSLNADWAAGTALPDCDVVECENTDGERVEAVVYYPPGFDPDGEERAPAVCSVHGGPMSYDAPSFDFPTAHWASRGYVVVEPNYRGSTSYGRAFAEALKGSRGDLESDDVIAAVDALVADGVADPERLFCTGFSYGGVTTAHVVTRTDEFAAAAPEHGVYDFYSTFGTDDNHNWHEWEFGLPWENAETYRDLSSITRVGEIDTPLLITAGEEDWRCPPTQAEQLYVSVRKRGVDAKLVVYPDEHHDVGEPRRATHRMETLTEWFEEHDPGGTRTE